MGQPGFFDLGERYRGLDAKKDPLVVLNAVVPWEDFRARLSTVWRKPEEERTSAAGRKPWDAIVIFTTLVLQALYNLSDDQVEDQIRDRLSFMRVLGLGLADRVPDATTVWLYREKLAQAGLVEALFEAFNAHLKTLCATPLASLRAPSMLQVLMRIRTCSIVQNGMSRASATSLIDQRLSSTLTLFCSARWRLRYMGGGSQAPPCLRWGNGPASRLGFRGFGGRPSH